MITDKDREDAESIWLAYDDGDKESAAQYVAQNRAESAEQAMKESAEKIEAMKSGNSSSVYDTVLTETITTILGDSAPVSTDSEKLAIAVKALEDASIILSKTDGDYDALCTIRQALKEIQG